MFASILTRRLVLIALLLFLFTAATIPVALRIQQPAQENGLFALARPLFLTTAHAEDNSAAAFIDSEAGIAAYFQAPGALSLATARPLFRTIEAETDTYLIGSVAVPDYASESEDVHLYIHKDGWVLAYYLAAAPAANIIDWARFDGTTIVTKFDTVFQLLAAQLAFTLPSPTYYDFRYPNANYLLLVAESTNETDTFTVFLNEAISYYERSWSLSSEQYSAKYTLNSIEILNYRFSDSASSWDDREGTFTPIQLPVNATHTITVVIDPPWATAFGGLALVYRRN